MNWPDYVVLAEGLAGERHEAAQRSAVSRAYYGALNVCRCWLETNVAPVDRHRIHAQVWGFFDAEGHAATRTSREWRLVADLGRKLRLLRNRADYEGSFPDLGRHAAEAVRAAKQILALLPELELAD
ncbi:MAG TPA: hypothetical protein VGH14_16540 [Solirubrobacterales bacterium]